MQVEILKEHGYDESVFGIGLSFGLTSGKNIYDVFQDVTFDRKIYEIAKKLAFQGGGENKFLRQIKVWIDINAPRYWWEQMATYKIGTCFQSESTMHTLTKKEFDISMFATEYMSKSGEELLRETINVLNIFREEYLKEENIADKKRKFYDIISNLPQSFLQRRITTMNYAVLQNIIDKRRNHKLYEWRNFCRTIMDQVEYPEFLFPEKETW